MKDLKSLDPGPSEMSKSSSELWRDEHAIRDKLKAGKLHPTPAGVIVTGRMGVFAAPRTKCEGHLFLTKKPKKNDKWQSGWVQGAKCLVCEDEIIPLDATWWMERATPQRIKLTMRLVKEEALRMKVVYRKLQRRLDALRDS
jgi:hypothetical protein